MLIKEFSEFLEVIGSNKSRNFKVETLCEFLGKTTEVDIAPFMYLIDGRVAPRYSPLEFNMSSNLVLRAIQQLYPNENIEEIYSKAGDVGDVIFNLKDGFTTPINLSLIEVFDTLKKIAQTTGKGSQDIKQKILCDLFDSTDKSSSKYIARIILGKMRLGLNDKTVLDALSWKIQGDKKLREILDRAYGVRSDLGEISRIVLFESIEKLQTLSIIPGMAVAAKLVEREKDTEKIYHRLQDCIIQPKFDGLRAQIHFSIKGFQKRESEAQVQNEQISIVSDKKYDVSIFSRNMESMTDMFPDIVQSCGDLGVDSFVIDSEIIGYDENQDNFIPFQETMTRKRKYGVSEKADSVPIRVYAFDLMYINGEDVTQYPLVKRLELLKDLIPKDHSIFKLSESFELKSGDEIEGKFDEYINKGLEGIIAKGKDTIYKPGTRNFDWIKLKATSKAGFVDTIDAVVMGYYLGKGQRTKFGIGAILIGLYDEEQDQYVSLAKVGTGVKDDEWVTYKNKLDQHIIDSKPLNYLVGKELTPDVWVLPMIVSEVEYDQITKSKVHLAGRDDTTGVGYSIRFPRMKIFEREKRGDQSTSIVELKRMFDLQ